MTANVLGGYDENVTAGVGSGAGAMPRAVASGSTGYFDTTLQYFRGSQTRSIRARSSGNVRAYPGLLDEPVGGGAAALEATTTLGRKHSLSAAGQVGYEPLLTVAPLPVGDSAAPSVNSDGILVGGLLARRSLNSGGSVSIDRAWSREASTRLSYGYTDQRFVGGYGDNRSHRASADFRKRLSRGVSMRAGYGYTDSEATNYGGTTRPNIQHRVDGGPEIDIALSRRRRLGLSLGGGASYIETIGVRTTDPYRYWAPFANAAATLDLTPTWSLTGGYRRSVSLLQGLTNEFYNTDSAYISTSRLITPRTDVRVEGTFFNGRTPVLSGVTEDFQVYGASTRLRIAISNTMAATIGYYYYRHSYSNPATLPVGFPSEYDRNAVRVGLTLWVPLLGGFTAPPVSR